MDPRFVLMMKWEGEYPDFDPEFFVFLVFFFPNSIFIFSLYKIVIGLV